MSMIFRYRFVILGAIFGAVGGYLYYFFVGCNTGSCAITSDPVNSTLYGAVIGGLFVNMFRAESATGGEAGKKGNGKA
ncbi:MAG TPA: DUF6132 family protein [Chryseosolibacter sp.]